jgi:type VI secretion system secreted protein Hcp
MAVDMFLKLDGIDGESTDALHKDWIEVSSFSWGLSQVGVSSTGGGGGAGKVSFQDLHFEKLFDKSSALLAQKCATGAHIVSGTLSMRKAGGDNSGAKGDDFLKIKMTDVLISSYQTAGANGGDDRPADGASLNFLKIELQYQPPGFDLVDVILDVRQSP